jgi:hypothetical protein
MDTTLALLRTLVMGVNVVGALACGHGSPKDAEEGRAEGGAAPLDAADGMPPTSALDAAGGGADASSLPGADGQGGCAPGDVSSYRPSWHPPASPRASCTEAELDDLEAACFEAISTSLSCDAFQQASPACWSCMVTPDTNDAWGPIVASSITELLYGNFAGCIALRTGDQSAAGCGAKQQAARVCSETACRGCPMQTDPELAAVVQCTSDALDADCASYQSAAVACAEGLLDQGGTSAAAEKFCNAGNYGDLATYYRALGPLFCGASPDDGGGAMLDGGDAGDAGD